MPEIGIDLETRSAVDLRKTGVYAYAESETTDVLCAAFAVDDGPIKLWIPGEPVPSEIERGVDEDYTFRAFNSNFEITLWHYVLTPRHGWPEPKLEQWRCTMAAALAMALPASLENAAAAVGLDIGKDMSGHRLMLQMSQPRRPRKGEDPNGVYWWEEEEKKQRLYDYCRRDIEVERGLDKRLLRLTEQEQALWCLDQRINRRGIFVDEALCEAALAVVDQATEGLNAELRAITENAATAATNVNQIAAWLREQGHPTESLDKAAIDQMLLRDDLTGDVRRVLTIRREAAKASVKKIDALLAGRSKDGRAKGLTQYHAASTGRWAGRRFQPQNIKRPELKNVDEAIEVVATGSAALVRARYPSMSPLAVVGDCLRGLVRAQPGKVIRAGDFSNIEGRVLAWLAGEQWKLDAFSAYDRDEGPDIYKLAYARSFGVPIADVDDHKRQVGKVMELALGFGGGVGAFQKMAAGYEVKVSDAKADDLKQRWREAHPYIQRFWWDLENAALYAVRNPGKTRWVDRVAFRRVGDFLYLRLPSGRTLVYPYAAIKPKATPWGETRDAVTYKGVDSYTRKWGDCWAYGGLWAENVTQAVARDILAAAMFRLEDSGHPVILTVHDEIVCEVPPEFSSVVEFKRVMCELPDWAVGLPLAAKTWEGERYRK